jgi:hypothetical protein
MSKTKTYKIIDLYEEELKSRRPTYREDYLLKKLHVTRLKHFVFAIFVVAMLAVVLPEIFFMQQQISKQQNALDEMKQKLDLLVVVYN